MDKSILERVKHRIREHGENYKINQLCIDQLPIGQFSLQITKQLQKCINVEYATFEYCNLISLINLPRFPKLQSLQIGHNKIQGSAINSLTKYSNLENLSLEQNCIASIEDLKPLQICKQLTKIKLHGNPVCDNNYRSVVFSLLPQVEVIDGFNRMGQAVQIQSSSQAQSEFSDSEMDLSDEQAQRQSPNKLKRKN